ncbi:MAG: hypothetical protein IJ184_01255 [Alphaproteobacteria bacterium]|nr:hypothetical protein [Alphaproteobacteria bacterium]
MTKYIAMLSILLFTHPAFAEDCNITTLKNTVCQGYEQKADSSCGGNNIVRCPFDTSYIWCKSILLSNDGSTSSSGGVDDLTDPIDLNLNLDINQGAEASQVQKFSTTN